MKFHGKFFAYERKSRIQCCVAGQTVGNWDCYLINNDTTEWERSWGDFHSYSQLSFARPLSKIESNLLSLPSTHWAWVVEEKSVRIDGRVREMRIWAWETRYFSTTESKIIFSHFKGFRNFFKLWFLLLQTLSPFAWCHRNQKEKFTERLWWQQEWALFLARREFKRLNRFSFIFIHFLFIFLFSLVSKSSVISIVMDSEIRSTRHYLVECKKKRREEKNHGMEKWEIFISLDT